MKKIISLLMCLALLLTLALPAFAEEGDSGSGGEGQSQTDGTGDNNGDSGGDNGGSGGDNGGTGGDNGGSGGDNGGSGGDNGGSGGDNGGSGGDNGGSGGDNGDSGGDNGGSGGDDSGDTSDDGSNICKHNWVKVTVPASCVQEGGTVIMCSICEGVDSVTVTQKLPHTYDNACDKDCNACGDIRTIEHKFSAGWDHNSTKHWHPCSICGEQGDLADHYPGPAATEEKDQFCLTCGRLMMSKIVHTHNYSKELSTDEQGHWYACDGCEEQKDFAYHIYDDLCDPMCNVCGYMPPTAHSYGDSYTSDASSHWQVCVLCGEVTPEEPHVPDTDFTEEEAQLCTVCGYALAPAKVHIHDFSTDWAVDHTNHWRSCTCGETSDNAAHIWEESGEGLMHCPVCGAQRAEDAQQGNSFPWIILLVVALAAALGCVVALVILLKPKKKSGGKYR